MNKKLYLIFPVLFLFTVNNLSAQDKMPYRIFDKNGKKTTYAKMLEVASKHEVILFGEHHDNSIIHWLELTFTKDLVKNHKVVLGAEMIESDNQAQLNQYLRGEINQKQFDTVARLWPNHKKDYKPLVDFAKENKIEFIASNVPRRYASMVYKSGFEALDNLPQTEKNFMAPLPILYDNTMPGYVRMVAEIEGHGGENLPKAQAIKDATMAWFITHNLKPDTVFIHYNGTYHSENFEGIFWYLKKTDPKLKVLTIATVSQADISTLVKDNYNKADFIIVTDEDVTKTY